MKESGPYKLAIYWREVVDGFRCDVAAASGVQNLAHFDLLGHRRVYSVNYRHEAK